MRVTLACVLLVVLAGCGGVSGPFGENGAPTPEPTDAVATATPDATGGTESPTTESTDEDATSTTESSDDADIPTLNSTVEVVDGEYRGNATKIFHRMSRITGTHVRPPTVYIESPDESDVAVYDDDRSPFRVSLGIVPPESDSEPSAGVSLGAYTSGENDTVHVYEASNGDNTLLAHEFVHVIQGRLNWSNRLIDAQHTIDGNYTSDGVRTYRLLSEGGATYVEAHYEERYNNVVLNATQRQRFQYEEADSALPRLNIARYHLGAQHVAAEVSSPTELGSVYEEPPVSTEQVLHHTDDPVADLNVSADAGEWSVESRDRHGELFVRTVLREELDRSAAVDAAHGWGVDERVTYARGNETGTAWALRWDDSANATEFEAALDQFLDNRTTQENGLRHATDREATYRVERPTDETVVFLLGAESFVRNATVSGSTGNVSIDVSEQSDGAAAIDDPRAGPSPAVDWVAAQSISHANRVS